MIDFINVSKVYEDNGAKALNDVTGLTIKNVSGTVLARGYVIYSDGTKQSIEYSDIASAD